MEPAAKADNTDVNLEPFFRATGPLPSEAGPPTDEANVASVTDQADPNVVPAGSPPLAGNPPFYAGLWNDYPIFKCPYCSYTALESHGGSGAIELHILNQIDRGNKGHLPALALKED